MHFPGSCPDLLEAEGGFGRSFRQTSISRTRLAQSRCSGQGDPARWNLDPVAFGNIGFSPSLAIKVQRSRVETDGARYRADSLNKGLCTPGKVKGLKMVIAGRG